MTFAKRLASVCLSGLSCLATVATAADGDVHAWLARMNQAVHELDYEGHFVYQVGDALESLYMVHRLHDGAEKERLIVLNGAPREVIRNDQAVACLIPGAKKIDAGAEPGHGHRSPMALAKAADLDAYYRLQLGDEERVAGRPTQLLEITPKDSLRYGYRLFLDKVSALPLRSQVLDEDGDTLFQLMFVELKLGPQVTPIEHDLSAMQSAVGEALPKTGTEEQPGWRFRQLPPGFMPSAYRQRPATHNDGIVEHFIFSDGLAAVSVYIEATEPGGLNGGSHLGSVQAFGRYLHGHQITAVGEVPGRTLQLFLDAVEPVAP